MSLSHKRALLIVSLQQVLYRFEEQRLVQIKQKLFQLETEIECAVKVLNDTTYNALTTSFANRLSKLTRESNKVKDEYRDQMQAIAAQHRKVKAAQEKLSAAAADDELHRDQIDLQETIESIVYSKQTSLP